MRKWFYGYIQNTTGPSYGTNSTLCSACSTNMVTKLPTQAVCVQPFLSFTIIRLLFVSLFFTPIVCILFSLLSFTFYFILLSILYLPSVFFTLCLCAFEPINFFIVSLPTFHSLHISTLQHLINRISNVDIFLVLGRAGPDFVGLTSLSIYSITFWNLDRARRDFVGLTSF